MANQPKKYTKFVAAAATATLVASAIVPVASAASFSDVADTNSHAVNINALVEAGIIKGFEDGTFKPGQDLTRGHVVKMLGKWVEAQGFEIPADYATKARFNDVAVDAKDQELVKYAALVADTGVFNGSNGALNAGGNITRENMALVLDRAFKAINEVSLVELAAEIEDAKINDLTTAKAEAREAIQALRDLGISVVEDFNPKGTVTRGQFASFLNKTINTEAVVELTVKEAVAVDANTVSVTLSDDTKHTVKLDKALEANKATEIKFTIDEKEYTATVTYVVDKLEVVSVSAIDAGTIQVKFNTEVKESSLITNDVLNENVISLTEDVKDGNTAVLNSNPAELSEDGKTLTIYTDKLEGNYKLAIAKDRVLTADSKIALPAVEAKFNIVDKTRASIVDVKNTSKYVFEINLSEPVEEASLAGITAKLEDGTSVISGTPTLTNNGKTIVVTLVTDNKNVNAGKDVKVIVPALTDIAGNVSVPQTQTVKVTNADIVEPTLVSAVASSNTTVDVEFSEAVTVNESKFTFNGKSVTVAPKSGDNTKTKFVVTIAEADKSAAAYLELAEGAATDLAGNESLKASKLVTFTGDKVAPTIISNSVKTINSTDYLVVKFSEKVTKGEIASLAFKYNDKFGVEQSLPLSSPVITEVDGSEGTEYTIALNEQFEENVAYSVELAKGSFVDVFANELAKSTVNFTFNPADTAATKKLVATVGSESAVDKDGRYITVAFDKTVDAASATNAANYTVEGAQVKEVKLATNGTDGASVKVYLVDNTVEISGNYKVAVANVKGFNTAIAAMDKFEETVAISENVKATVAGKTITFDDNTVATLTFSEAVTVGEAADYELFIDGVKVTTEGVTVNVTAGEAESGKEAVVTIAGLNLSKDIAAGKKVVLKAVESFDIKDAAGNFASTVDVVLN